MRVWGVDQVLRDMGASDATDIEGGDITLVSFVHGMPRRANDEWIYIDMQSYDINGRRYRYTGAHYDFGMDSENGGT